MQQLLPQLGRQVDPDAGLDREFRIGFGLRQQDRKTVRGNLAPGLPTTLRLTRG